MLMSAVLLTIVSSCVLTLRARTPAAVMKGLTYQPMVEIVQVYIFLISQSQAHCS